LEHSASLAYKYLAGELHGVASI